MLWQFLAFVVIFSLGVVSGILNGLFGIGGGTLMVPFFIFWFRTHGYSLDQASILAIVVSLLAMIPASLLSFYQHRKKGVGSLPEVLLLFGGGWCGSLLGSEFALLWKGKILVLLFSGLELYIGLSLLLPGARAKAEGVTRNQGEASASLSFSKLTFISWISTGFLSGLLSTLFGIGGGIVAVPLQLFLLKKPIHDAVANSTGLIILNAGIGSARYLFSGTLPMENELFLLPLALALGAITGAPQGVRLAHRLDSHKLRRLYGAFLILVSVLLVLEAIGGTAVH